MSVESFWIDRYKASRPDPSHIHGIIAAVLSAEFNGRFQINRVVTTEVDFTVDDLWCSITIQPELKSLVSNEWQSGKFNHNGRWRLELSCPSVHPVSKRPTDKGVKAVIEGFIPHIKTALERLQPGRPKLRLV